MRRIVIAVAAALLAACAQQAGTGNQADFTQEQREAYARLTNPSPEYTAEIQRNVQRAAARRAEAMEIINSGQPDTAPMILAAAERRARAMPEWPADARSPAQRRAVEARRAELIGTERASVEGSVAEVRRLQAAEAAQIRHQQAAIICRARGNMAASQPVFGGFGIAGAINAGLQQGWAGASVEANCLAAHEATGIMPSL